MGFCGVAILDFSGYVSWKGRYQTMPLVIFVYICPILGNVPFEDDVEYLACLVTDIAITRGVSAQGVTELSHFLALEG